MNGYVLVAYSKNPPYLPCAVVETSKELAEKVGTTKISIDTARKENHGNARGVG